MIFLMNRRAVNFIEHKRSKQKKKKMYMYPGLTKN